MYARIHSLVSNETINHKVEIYKFKSTKYNDHSMGKAIGKRKEERLIEQLHRSIFIDNTSNVREKS